MTEETGQQASEGGTPSDDRRPKGDTPSDDPRPKGDTPSDDPRPAKPIEPDALDCCGEGCVPCVYDLYEEALERYKAELAAWLKRHPEAKP